MRFGTIRYMRWARAHLVGTGSPPFSLASSAISHLQPADLGLHLDGLDLTAPSAQGLPELRGLLSHLYGIPSERILLTAGCTMGNFLLMAALVRPGDAVVLEHPVYEPLRRNLELLGARLVRLARRPQEGYRVDPERLERLLRRHRPRLVVLTNLHNPSGAYTPPQAVGEIGRLARRHGARVLWDEVYLESMAEPTSPAAALDERALSTMSLSKVYGLGGLRSGWCFGPPSILRRACQVADYLLPHQAPLLECLVLRALEQRSELRRRSLEQAARNRRLVESWLAGRPDLEWWPPPSGHIAFCRFTRPDLDSRRLERRLLEDHRTLVSPGHFFGDPGGFRLGFGHSDPAILEQGLAELSRTLDRLGPPGKK